MSILQDKETMENRDNFNFYLASEDEQHAFNQATDVPLFGPVLRKMMLYIAICMAAIFLAAILYSYPLTLIPFFFTLWAVRKYRKARRDTPRQSLKTPKRRK
jgi:hypothetical protein